MDEEYLAGTIVTPKYIVRIWRPIITEEERAKRMAEIKKAAENLARANLRLQAQREQAQREKTMQ